MAISIDKYLDLYFKINVWLPTVLAICRKVLSSLFAKYSLILLLLIKLLMKKFKFILVLAFVVTAVSSCGRKDRCPSVGKVNTVNHTVIA